LDLIFPSTSLPVQHYILSSRFADKKSTLQQWKNLNGGIIHVSTKLETQVASGKLELQRYDQELAAAFVRQLTIILF
jgi:hypothetical protein